MGSITLSRGATSVTLDTDLNLQRKVGRPNSELRPRPGELPNYIDKVRSASDVFELSGEFHFDGSEETARSLVEDVVRPPLGRGSLELSFDDGLFGLGTYEVVPDGSQAARISYTAGEKGVVRVGTLNLRVVNNG